jgi:Zn-dependent metalloprotease|tara:strand:- start:109 stop:594 length:486 start_codon:yes stop_codon:yes gene_type:complete
MAKDTKNKTLKHNSTYRKEHTELSVKHRLFARYKAQGMSNGKSAELAGYKAGINASKQGSLLAKKPAIIALISELLAEQDTRSLVDRESHLMELAKLRDKAVDSGQIGSAVTAEHYRGKVANLYKDRIEVEDSTSETSSEIMDRIKGLLGKSILDSDESIH